MSRHAAKVTSKGQITIPKPIRDLMELDEGDYLVMECDDDRLIARKAAVPPTEDFDLTLTYPRPSRSAHEAP